MPLKRCTINIILIDNILSLLLLLRKRKHYKKFFIQFQCFCIIYNIYYYKTALQYCLVNRKLYCSKQKRITENDSANPIIIIFCASSIRNPRSAISGKTQLFGENLLFFLLPRRNFLTIHFCFIVHRVCRITAFN